QGEEVAVDIRSLLPASADSEPYGLVAHLLLDPGALFWRHWGGGIRATSAIAGCGVSVCVGQISCPPASRKGIAAAWVQSRHRLISHARGSPSTPRGTIPLLWTTSV